MSIDIIPISTGNPEVVLEIPQIIKIGAFLRHWGYPVCPGVYYHNYPWRRENFTRDLYADADKLTLGMTVTTITCQEKRVWRGWLKWEIEISEEKVIEAIPVGEINLPLEDMVIDCYGIKYLPYLAEIADRLQKQLGQSVKIRLTRMGDVPLQSEGQILPLLADVQDDTASTLIKLVAKRVSLGTQIQTNPDRSLELWTNGINKPLRLLTLSSNSDPNSQIVNLNAVLYQKALLSIIKEEIAGIEETLHNKDKLLVSEIRENY